jgi:phage shock protein PspC (stress-responsive transcriptional regulator)
MKKTISANIAGTLFQIDEDAYYQLEQYFNKIMAGYHFSEEGKEITNDLESRLSELFVEKTQNRSQTITLEFVNWAIGILGKPEDIGANFENQSGTYENMFYNPPRRIYRDPDNKVISGVCSGLGAYFDVDPVLIRVIFVLLIFIGFGPLAYIILIIVIPNANTVTQKLEMHGEAPTPENIRKYDSRSNM